MHQALWWVESIHRFTCELVPGPSLFSCIFRGFLNQWRNPRYIHQIIGFCKNTMGFWGFVVPFDRVVDFLGFQGKPNKVQKATTLSHGSVRDLIFPSVILQEMHNSMKLLRILTIFVFSPIHSLKKMQELLVSSSGPGPGRKKKKCFLKAVWSRFNLLRKN